ncbi:MerR family transcriptional regulator [Sphaerotilus mobilis]|uniref:DNA-binding transcriptional MerR regulator n=1 Tax=Sphaerotilus mobilis TaxID=47994 RepID=A0A4Q7LTS0_9BURK|nr:MerR family transcriptional regulator [Sphaerotilus mobilis]RZS58465.1 DNA-binding transcriptional MerR regulator [Sphaerotilus mobilis]
MRQTNRSSPPPATAHATANAPALAPDPTPAAAVDATLHRSGAVARMLRMPVATLRVWERRYGLTQPVLSPSGQRLYDADDVRRLALIRQLTDLGHAIGRLAGLDMAQLQQVAATHAQALASRQAEPSALATSPGLRPWRVAVIGPTLAARLERPALLRRLSRAVAQVERCDSLDVVRARLYDGPSAGIDALLIHAPSLAIEGLESLIDASPGSTAWAKLPKAVLYRYGSEATCTALSDAGVRLLREPQPDAVLAQWLDPLARMTSTDAPEAFAFNGSAEPVSPRRWDDAALADFAGLSSTIACECPRHVAELLVQLSHFEAYSADCAHRSPDDADLHRYLGQISARARSDFEAALEAVARHEGLLLPQQAPRAGSA